MSLSLESSDARVPVLTVRRPLVRPAGDPRLLLRMLRRLFVRRTLLLLTVLLALCALYVALQHWTLQVGYRLAETRALLQRLDHRQRELKVELALLRDPRRLAERARRELGLVEPRPGQLVDLE